MVRRAFLFEPADISRLKRIALFEPAGASITYLDLIQRSTAIAGGLMERGLGRGDRVASLFNPSIDYVKAQWGTWMARGVAVPLATSHPPAELAYVLDDTRPRLVLTGEELRARLEPLCRERGIPCLSLDEVASPPGEYDPFGLEYADDALILYTSGTTARPKGVVITHGNLNAQIFNLIEAWEWSKDDHILLTLPLHHVHGIVNVLGCALHSGARCTILPRFDAKAVWEHLASGELTLYMAVPTVYDRLIAAYDAAGDDDKARWSAGARKLRLMVSGSAALAVQTLERWKEITGHTLLERYGMTEIGMALSNPYEGERVPGAVGQPLPGVEVRLVDETERVVGGDPARGEIQVKGPTVFSRYFEREEATREAFTDDGWFRTGDMAAREGGVYRILGRRSVDIIKTGGEKVSALEIEHVLRDHPAIAEVAVVGVVDDKWGEAVACAAVLKAGAEPLTLEGVREWARERLAPYKLPTRFVVVDALPKNAMGKVQKPALRARFESGAS